MKRPITFILTLLLTFVILFSATSCLATLDMLLGEASDLPSSDSQDETDNEKTDEEKNPSSGTSGEGEGSSGTQTGAPVFCPDTNNEGDLEGLRPEVRALLSTVAIDAKLDVYSTSIYGGGGTTEYTSYGSGIIYKLDKAKGDAYIITNYHVVYNSGEVAPGGFSDGISLYLYGMESEQYAIPAEVVGGSMSYDIAVLRVKDSEVLKNSLACEAKLGDSETVRVYDGVRVIGNPEGFGISATNGEISIESESLSMTGADGRTGITVRVMRVSAAVNDGNSGGGLYSEGGELIGIVNAKRTGEEVDNIGYAIPINLASRLADNIIKNCDGKTNRSLKKCFIGINLTVRSSGLVSDGKGSLVIKEQISVESLEESCITDKILAGDIINSVTIDGEKITVTRLHHVTESMLSAEVGSSVTLNITRGSETLDVTLTIPETALKKLQ